MSLPIFLRALWPTAKLIVEMPRLPVPFLAVLMRSLWIGMRRRIVAASDGAFGLVAALVEDEDLLAHFWGVPAFTCF